MSHKPVREFYLPRSVIGALLFICAAAGSLLYVGRRDFPHLHTILDTAQFLFSGLVGLLLWELGQRLDRDLHKWVALSFLITSFLELIHMVTSVEWSGSLAFIRAAEGIFRPTTWPPAAHILPLGIGFSVLMGRHPPKVSHFAIGLAFTAIGLLVLFHQLPYYSAPGWMGISRPTLFFVPFLWVWVGWSCWRNRAHDQLLPSFTLMAAILILAHSSMLYSRAPHDTEAMVAHLGKVGGYLILLLTIMQKASVDVLKRIQADRELNLLNGALECRVQERTALLESANASLEVEVTVRQEAVQKAQAHLERLNLLQQITRAIWERQDFGSILQVLIRNLEEQLPADFCCVCQHERNDQSNMVIKVGVRSHDLAIELALGENATFPVDQNGLARCLQGQLVYESDIAQVPRPFPQRLARGGLGSFVLVPLMLEDGPFGLLVVGRKHPEGFLSGECEFLKQLGDHVALAIGQNQLHVRLQHAYDDLRQTQQAMLQQERLRALGEMASGIAHDINNALSPVSMYLDLLGEDLKLNQKTRDRLGTIRGAVADVSQTIHRLSEFYRQREPGQPLSPVPLNHVVEQVAELSRVRWENMPLERGIVIRLRKDLDDRVQTIQGVGSELREMLTNLVFNAVDAMPEGGNLTLRTRLVETKEANQIHVEVVDDGSGMDEQTRRHCLEPFFTTKGERGTGLGLAMAYGIVRRHNAELEIDSVVGEGTTFRLIFPVTTNRNEQPAAPEITPEPLPPLNLLIIDDDPLVLMALQEALELDGHLVTSADGGAAGIRAFKEAMERGESFGAVFTDLGMPHIDGRKVAQSIKALSPTTPIILLSGWGQRMLSETELPHNVDRVLAKPPKILELRSALRWLVVK